MKRRQVSRETIAISDCPCGSGMGLREVIATDLARCLVLSERQENGAGPSALLKALLLYPGLYGVCAYRISHAALHAPLAAPLRAIAYLLSLLLHRVLISLTKVEISARAHIGPGLLVNHAQGVVVGPIVAGSNLTLSHFATLGLGGNAAQRAAEDPLDVPDHQRTAEGRCPRLGDRVWIGVGAVVSGDIRIGDDVMVGANAVVSTDLPPRSVAVSAAAQVTTHRGSFGFVHYRGMLDDPTRIASLARAES